MSEYEFQDELVYEKPMEGMSNGMSGMPNGMDTMEAEFEDAPPTPAYNLEPPMGMSVTTPATVPQAFQPSQALPKQHNVQIGAGANGPDPLLRVQKGLKSSLQSEAYWCLTTLLTFTTARNFDMLKSRLDIMTGVADYVEQHWAEVTAARSDLDDDYATLLARQKVLEALLILRNVTIDQGVAMALAAQTMPFVEQGAALPRLPLFTEMRLLCLEIGEHIAMFQPGLASESPLFKSLVQLLEVEHDKSVLVSSLRTLSRLLVFDTKETSPLVSYPNVVKKVVQYLTIDDSELVACSLELLSQLTARLQRVDQLASLVDQPISGFVEQIVRLICFKMDRQPLDYLRLPRRTRKPSPVMPPEITPPIMASLLRMPEPDRANMWIRASYDLDPEGEVLQVSLWTAYQRLFEPHERDGTGHRLLKAIDFIRTCTTNVKGAQAKVITTPEGPKKFIIKGLLPRETALHPSDMNGGPSAIPMEDDRPARQPPVYGSLAATVLLNIAKLQGGKELLTPEIREMLTSACVNPPVFELVDSALSEMGRN